METLNAILDTIDGYVWGIPLIAVILFVGILLTSRLGVLQVTNLGNALRYMLNSEKEGEGEVSSFAALCTALAATVGTGNIVGVATAIGTGGPGALFWMEVAAFFGMATKYAEGLLATARFWAAPSTTSKQVSRNVSGSTSSGSPYCSPCSACSRACSASAPSRR